MALEVTLNFAVDPFAMVTPIRSPATSVPQFEEHGGTTVGVDVTQNDSGARLPRRWPELVPTGLLYVGRNLHRAVDIHSEERQRLRQSDRWNASA